MSDRIALGENLRLVAATLIVSNETQNASSYIHRAVEISEGLQRNNPEDTKLLEELGRQYEAEADILAGSFNLSSAPL